MPASQFGVVAVLGRCFRLVLRFEPATSSAFGVELHDASGKYAGPRKLYKKPTSRIAGLS